MISKYVDSASTFSGDIDHLIFLVTAIVGFWFLLAEGVFFYFIIRYTAQEGVKAKYVAGEDPKEKRWVAIPHYLTLGFDHRVIDGAVADQFMGHIKKTLENFDETAL